MTIVSKPAGKSYLDGWERMWGEGGTDRCPHCWHGCGEKRARFHCCKCGAHANEGVSYISDTCIPCEPAVPHEPTEVDKATERLEAAAREGREERR